MLSGLYPDRLSLALFHCQVDTRAGSITWVNGGQASALIIGGDSTGYVKLDGAAPALGVTRHAVYEQRTAAFQAGDVLVAVSRSLGDELLMETVSKHRYDSARDLSRRLLRAGTVHADSTVVVVRSIEAAASLTSTSRPWGTRLRQLTWPPHESTQLLTMASPRPVPPVSRCLANSGR